jgi:hypothetical protein
VKKSRIELEPKISERITNHFEYDSLGQETKETANVYINGILKCERVRKTERTTDGNVLWYDETTTYGYENIMADRKR